MDAGFQLEKHVQVYEKVLRLAAFNLYSHNRDDHSKNFSFLMNSALKWKFAPAYDLTFFVPQEIGTARVLLANTKILPKLIC